MALEDFLNLLIRKLIHIAKRQGIRPTPLHYFNAVRVYLQANVDGRFDTEKLQASSGSSNSIIRSYKDKSLLRII